MSASIEAALRTLGVRCSVETRGTLAIVIPAPGERALEAPEVRREALAILRAHGFTHAAAEPGGDDAEAAQAEPGA